MSCWIEGNCVKQQAIDVCLFWPSLILVLRQSLTTYTMVETGWLEAALKADRVMENMPYYYRQHCLSVKVLRKHMESFLQPRKAVTEQIASSSLNIQPGGITGSEPREHNSVQERDSPPNDLSLQVTEFSKLLIAQIYKMNKFLVSTHLKHTRTATVSNAARLYFPTRFSFICLPWIGLFLLADFHDHAPFLVLQRFIFMRQDAERRQKMIEPPFFEYGRVTSKELEEIRLATFRLYSDMYQLLFFSKINCEGTWNCIFLVRKLHLPFMLRFAHSFSVDYIDVKSSSKSLHMGFLARQRWK